MTTRCWGQLVLQTKRHLILRKIPVYISTQFVRVQNTEQPETPGPCSTDRVVLYISYPVLSGFRILNNPETPEPCTTEGVVLYISYPVLSGSRILNNPETPGPCTTDGVVLYISYPVLSGSRILNNPETPDPCTTDGVVLSSDPAGYFSFFWADSDLVGVVPRDLGVPGAGTEGCWLAGVLCWKSSARNSWKETLPSPSASSLSNNCCNSWKYKHLEEWDHILLQK